MPATERPRTALVTGGNRGLGLETCRQLAAEGFDVLLTARGDREGREAATALAREGLPVAFRRLDVTDEASIATLADQLATDGVRLGVLVNNAAIALDGFDADVARKTLDADFYGPMRITDALVDLIADGGAVVMVSSGAGDVSGLAPALRRRFLDPALTRDGLVALVESFIGTVADGTYRQAGWPGSAYRVSKAALNALTRLMAEELDGRQIRVNAVCPGWVRTDMGGRGAPRTVARGAASILWAALLPPDGPTGGFYRDGKPIAW